MLRIFITSSPLSTSLMALYAKKTNKVNSKDILVIDNYYKKKSLLELIKTSADIHQWDHILDFSIPIDNNLNLEIGFRKKVTRKLKTLPIIRNVYQFLLRNYVNHKVACQEGLIIKKNNEISSDVNQYKKVELYLLTQTSINQAFINLFPDASIYYMEHGLIDYLLIMDISEKDGFFCVFADKYKQFISRRNISFPIYKYITKEEFTDVFLPTSERLKLNIQSIEKKSPKQFILFLMDALEKFNPLARFWTEYIDRCLMEIDNPLEYTILVKPHPDQSNEVIEITENYFQKLGLDFIMLNTPEFISLSAETIYIVHQKRIDYVFSTFSAALFYLSYYYSGKSKFYNLYKFVGPYIKNAPKQYIDSYNQFNNLIKEVFANENCIALDKIG